MEDSTTTTGSGPPSSSRSARGSIAAQACETCRARKQKCDEARPQVRLLVVCFESMPFLIDTCCQDPHHLAPRILILCENMLEL